MITATVRHIVANCATPTDHPMHVSDPSPSMHQSVDGVEVRLCPGGRMGDKRIREWRGTVADLCGVVRVEQLR